MRLSAQLVYTGWADGKPEDFTKLVFGPSDLWTHLQTLTQLLLLCAHQKTDFGELWAQLHEFPRRAGSLWKIKYFLRAVGSLYTQGYRHFASWAIWQRWQQAPMGRVPGHLCSHQNKPQHWRQCHQSLLGSSWPDDQHAECAPYAFENLTFLGLMCFSQRTEAEDKGTPAFFFLSPNRYRKLWTFQNCWYLPNCSVKNEM